MKRRQWQPTRRTCLKGLAASVMMRRSARAGEADPIPSLDERIGKLSEDAPLRLRFRGTSVEDCRKWQHVFGAKLRALLGPHRPPAQWETVCERVVELKDHRREELVLTAEGHPSLPVYLLIPHGKVGKRRPGVVAVHGHGKYAYDSVAGREDLPGVTKEIEKFNYDYGRQLVRRGYVVAAPCMTPFGRRLGDRSTYRGNDPCAVTFVRMQLLGKVLMAENLRDLLWTVELLARHPDVDANRLGCVGLSYGGRMTMLTTALEPRIRVAVISGALNVMQERITKRYSCGAQVIPGLLQYGDVPEIASLIAPRPCLWEVGTRDGLISKPWADRALARIRRAYRALGAEDRLHVEYFDAGHRWNGGQAYALLQQVLKP